MIAMNGIIHDIFMRWFRFMNTIVPMQPIHHSLISKCSGESLDASRSIYDFLDLISACRLGNYFKRYLKHRIDYGLEPPPICKKVQPFFEIERENGLQWLWAGEEPRYVVVYCKIKIVS